MRHPSHTNNARCPRVPARPCDRCNGRAIYARDKAAQPRCEGGRCHPRPRPDTVYLETCDDHRAALAFPSRGATCGFPLRRRRSHSLITPCQGGRCVTDSDHGIQLPHSHSGNRSRLRDDRRARRPSQHRRHEAFLRTSWEAHTSCHVSLRGLVRSFYRTLRLLPPRSRRVWRGRHNGPRKCSPPRAPCLVGCVARWAHRRCAEHSTYPRTRRYNSEQVWRHWFYQGAYRTRVWLWWIKCARAASDSLSRQALGRGRSTTQGTDYFRKIVAVNLVWVHTTNGWISPKEQRRKREQIRSHLYSFLTYKLPRTVK